MHEAENTYPFSFRSSRLEVLVPQARTETLFHRANLAWHSRRNLNPLSVTFVSSFPPESGGVAKEGQTCRLQDARGALTIDTPRSHHFFSHLPETSLPLQSTPSYLG